MMQLLPEDSLWIIQLLSTKDSKWIILLLSSEDDKIQLLSTEYNTWIMQLLSITEDSTGRAYSCYLLMIALWIIQMLSAEDS